VRISDILKVPRRTRRVAHIARKCMTHGMGFLVGKLNIQQVLPAWARLPSATRDAEPPDLPERLARVLEELGPTFVKFGQMLSTRPDLLPDDYLHALQRICHHVAPFPSAVARTTIEDELGRAVEEIFKEFSDEPLASGSMAQTHTALLPDGTEVVVKVRRPGIERVVDDDLAIMEFLALQADRLEEFQPLRIPMMVDEFARGVRRELNLLTEAASTHKFHAAFREDKDIMVPQIYWDYTTPRVLTMQKLEGVHVSDLDERDDADGLKRTVARLILDKFLVQFFELGAFHADPHIGNILVTQDGRIGLIDFGLTGRLNATLRGQLGMFLVSLGSQQFELAAEVLGDIGSLPLDADVDDFSSEVATLLDRYYSLPFDKIDLQRAFLEVMEVVRKYRVVMPRDFVLLGKAMVTVGGMVTRMDPGLNAAELARPYARKLMADKLKPGALMHSATASAHQLSTLIRNAPRDLKQLFRRLREGVFQVAVDHRGLERYLTDLDRTGNRLALSIMLAAIVISSTHMLTSEVGPAVTVFGWDASILGLLGYLFGFVLGVWLVIGIFRSGRI